MPIHLLPTEVFELIAAALSKGQQLQCLLVSRAWYDIFLPVLYRSVPLTHECNILSILQDPTRSVSQHVRALTVDDGVLTMASVAALRELCPLLRELHFCWRRAQGASAGGPSKAALSRSPVPILEAIDTRELRTLDLTCGDDDTEESSSGNRQRLAAPRAAGVALTAPGMMESLLLPAILQFTGHIESLTLINVLPILRTTELDTIHAACPRLAHLVVEGTNMVLTPVVTDRVHASLRTLRIAYPSGWSRTDLWIDYIVTHYPGLRTLDLVNSAPGSPVLRPVLRGPTSVDLAQRALPAHLHRLRLLGLGDYGVDGQYLTPLTRLPALDDVEIRSQRAWNPETWLRGVSERLARLAMELPTTDVLPTLIVVSGFQRLVELRLDMARAGGGVHDILAHACPPTLRHLALLNGVFDLDDDDADTPAAGIASHLQRPNALGITRLTLDDMLIVDADMLAFAITVYCPNLTHLDATRCMWFSSTPPRTRAHHTNVIHIDFAAHSFSTLSLSQSRILLDPRPARQSVSHVVRCYGFVCGSRPTKERIGRKRQRGGGGSGSTPWFITFDNSSPQQPFREGQEQDKCIIVKCKQAKQLWIDGYQV